MPGRRGSKSDKLSREQMAALMAQELMSTDSPQKVYAHTDAPAPLERQRELGRGRSGSHDGQQLQQQSSATAGRIVGFGSDGAAQSPRPRHRSDGHSQLRMSLLQHGRRGSVDTGALAHTRSKEEQQQQHGRRGSITERLRTSMHKPPSGGGRRGSLPDHLLPDGVQNFGTLDEAKLKAMEATEKMLMKSAVVGGGCAPDLAAVLTAVTQLPPNQSCFQCGIDLAFVSLGSLWASTTWGVVLCSSCAGVHRGLGVEVSFVRSVGLDKWTAKEVNAMRLGGNEACSAALDGGGASEIEPAELKGAPMAERLQWARERFSTDEATVYSSKLAGGVLLELEQQASKKGLQAQLLAEVEADKITISNKELQKLRATIQLLTQMVAAPDSAGLDSPIGALSRATSLDAPENGLSASHQRSSSDLQAMADVDGEAAAPGESGRGGGVAYDTALVAENARLREENLRLQSILQRDSGTSDSPARRTRGLSSGARERASGVHTTHAVATSQAVERSDRKVERRLMADSDEEEDDFGAGNDGNRLLGLDQWLDQKAAQSKDLGMRGASYEEESMISRHMAGISPRKGVAPDGGIKQRPRSFSSALAHAPRDRFHPHSSAPHGGIVYAQSSEDPNVAGMFALDSIPVRPADAPQRADVSRDPSPRSEEALPVKLELEETYEAGEVNAKASFRLLLDTGMACDHVRPPSRAITVEQTANSMVRLFWDERPRTVLVVKKPRDEASTRLLCEIAQFLREQKLVEQVLVEPPVFEELGQPAYLSSWDDRGASGSADKAAGIVRQDCGKAEKASVDVVVCLGGDGTMLWVSGLFPSAVPPVVSFSMGSLGFLTPYKSSNFKRVMRNVLEDGCQLTVRMRLFCQVVKGKAVSQLPSADARLKARSPTMAAPAMQAMAAAAVAGGGGSGAGAGTGNARTPTVMKFAPVPASIATPPFQTSVLNEVVIDRGPQMSLVMLDVFCDDVFVTRVQADGIIIATPTGSTAYSMSAGGSMVHPAVPCMLFTPICPHSLSFRPLLFPDSALLRCEIPASSRNNSWVSFDGKFRQEMRPGDSLLLRVGRYPMPSVCSEGENADWLASVNGGLHFNERLSQKPGED